MSSAPKDEDEIEASRAPLLDHLVELRSRIIKSLVALALAFVVCYAFSEQIYGILVRPLADAMQGQEHSRLIYTQLYEVFFTYVRVGLFGAMCLAFPYVATQVWLFVAPGLYRDERAAFLPFLLATPVMFTVGALIAYYLMMPITIRFFIGFQTDGSASGLPIELEQRVSEYLGYAMTMIFGCGLSFQLPVLLTLLGRVGIVSSQGLKEFRRYAVVLVAVAAAIFTPPDPISMLLLAAPLVLLYEVSIWLVWLIEKRAAEKTEAPAA